MSAWGVQNRFRQPCDDVEWLKGLPVYRTDVQGVVGIVTDGTQVCTETEQSSRKYPLTLIVTSQETIKDPASGSVLP